jgi:hypothetical protein
LISIAAGLMYDAIFDGRSELNREDKIESKVHSKRVFDILLSRSYQVFLPVLLNLLKYVVMLKG